MWNPPSTKGTIQNPGLNGGGEWGGPAFDPATEILYINGNNSPFVIGPRTEVNDDHEATHLHGTNLQVGKKLYQRNCSRCHGVDRRAGQTNPALATYPSLAGIQLPEGSVESLIATGRGTMPDFSYLSDAERTAIASYVLDLKSKQNEMFADSGQQIFRSTIGFPTRG